jgi:hypothetical protein
MYKVLILLFTISVVSCSSINLPNEDKIDTPIDISKIEGVYHNKVKNTRKTAWSYLLFKIDKEHGDFIKLKFISNNELLIELLEGNKVLGNEVIRGSFKYGYFHFSQRYKFIFHYGLMFLGDADIRIKSQTGGTLIVESCAGGGIFFPVIFTAGGNSYERTIEKVKNLNEKRLF